MGVAGLARLRCGHDGAMMTPLSITIDLASPSLQVVAPWLAAVGTHMQVWRAMRRAADQPDRTAYGLGDLAQSDVLAWSFLAWSSGLFALKASFPSISDWWIVGVELFVAVFISVAGVRIEDSPTGGGE